MRTRVLRRRRRSALCRRSDVVEEWAALSAAVVLCLVAPLVGVLTARWAHGEARATAVEQRAERQRVRVEVVERPVGARTSSEAGSRHVFRAPVRWSEPGEGPRSAVARVPADARAGDVVHVWFDSRGRAVPPPVDDASVWQYGIGMGTGAAGGTAAVALLVRHTVRRVTMRRRLAEWDRAWARTEPEWTHRGA
ncbi:hypothetical protein GCM10010297_24430 [Streptomyces malachitofuscus]|nr:hypothetical protein GCM10010297_24430 [Streptomyces malachitofuscus]